MYKARPTPKHLLNTFIGRGDVLIVWHLAFERSVLSTYDRDGLSPVRSAPPWSLAIPSHTSCRIVSAGRHAEYTLAYFIFVPVALVHVNFRLIMGVPEGHKSSPLTEDPRLCSANSCLICSCRSDFRVMQVLYDMSGLVLMRHYDTGRFKELVLNYANMGIDQAEVTA